MEDAHTPTPLSERRGAAGTSGVYAVFCVFVFLMCELIAHPFAEFGVADDWSYIHSARLLASTGHIVYNGWTEVLTGWQLFPAALLIKLFGFSYSTCRITTLLAAAVSTFLLQRIFVHSGVSERNSTISTLALVLSPIYMQLAATFMTDVHGLLAVLVCLYGCIRALKAKGPSGAITWLVVAAASDAILGSARQAAWLGVLLLVPVTAWLLRGVRKVMWAGLAATALGAIFVVWCMHWFKQQPGSISEPILIHVGGLHDLGRMSREMLRAIFELPLLLMALLAAFFPELRGRGKRFWAAMGVFAALYILEAFRLAPAQGPGQLLEPLLNDWLSPFGFYGRSAIASPPPVVLGTWIRILLTVLSLAGAWALAAFVIRISGHSSPVEPGDISLRTLAMLVVPFIVAYLGLLVTRSLVEIFDRYLLELTPFVALLCVRAYQDHVKPRLPAITIAAVVVIAIYSVGSTHDLFAFDRARAQLNHNLLVAGVQDTAIDGGFELYDPVELQHAPFINEQRLKIPAGYYLHLDPHRAPSCDGRSVTDERFRHGMPQFGFAFNPAACAGPANVPPVTYNSWLKLRSVTLYAVRYQGPY